MKKGISAVYGFLVIYLLIMAGLGAISNSVGAQFSVQQSVDRARQLDAQKSAEHLSLSLVNGSLSVVNDGGLLSTLRYIVARTGQGTSLSKLSYQLPVGGNLTVPAPLGARQVGLITASGNLYWDSSGSSTLNCANGSSSLTLQVSPAGAGTAEPVGLQSACNGQVVTIQAIPIRGYAFSNWVGNGTGSYTGARNPAQLVVHGPITETADFVAGLTLDLSIREDGIASGGLARSINVTAYGASQSVRFSTGPLPPGLNVSFSPTTLTDGPMGVSTTMRVSLTGTDYGLHAVTIIGSGADGQNASSTYEVQATPPDGNVSGAFPVNAGGLGIPREHKSAYWMGTYFLSFVKRTSSSVSQTLVPVTYSGGWTVGSDVLFASAPRDGTQYDLSQSSNQILYVATSLTGDSLCTNLGSIGGSSVNWQYGWASCGDTQAASTFTPVDFATSVVDGSGNLWGAMETVDSSGGRHIEVFTATNGAWSEVYLSPVLGVGAQPVPELLRLDKGAVILLYTLFTASSGCYAGDYFVYTNDGGYSWSNPAGPFYAGGEPLCYDQSSGTTIGDKLFVGGVNFAGSLAFWSYDFSTGSFSSATVTQSARSGAAGAVGNTFVLAYTSSGGCPSGDPLYLTWSHDNGSSWTSSGRIDCVEDRVMIPAYSATFQVPVLTAKLGFSGDLPRFEFYTI